MANNISFQKIKIIHEIYSKKEVNRRETARRLRISRTTLKRYISEIEQIKIQSPDSISNVNNYIVFLQRNEKTSERYLFLISIFPSVFESILNLNSNRKIEWAKYRTKVPEGFGFTQFAYYFSRWLRDKNLITKLKERKCRSIQVSDLLILKKWRRSVDRRKWEKAVVLLDSLKGIPISEISFKIERSRRKVIRWIRSYEKKGLMGLETPKKKFSEKIIKKIDDKKSNLIKLIHETPKNFGVNRTSWDLKSLGNVYNQIYGTIISKTMISEYIKSQGYAFRKAKKTLTSPDPKYKEKLQTITNILSNLTEKENKRNEINLTKYRIKFHDIPG